MKRPAIFLIVVPLMIGIFLPPVRRSTQGSKPIIANTSQAQLSQTGGLDGQLADLDYQKKQTSRK